LKIVTTQEEVDQCGNGPLITDLLSSFRNKAVLFEGVTLHSEVIADCFRKFSSENLILVNCNFEYKHTSTKHAMLRNPRINAGYKTFFRNCTFDDNKYLMYSTSSVGSSIVFTKCKIHGNLFIGDGITEIIFIDSDVNDLSFRRSAYNEPHPEVKIISSRINNLFSSEEKGGENKEIMFGMYIKSDTFYVENSTIKRFSIGGRDRKNCSVMCADKESSTMKALFHCEGVESVHLCDNFSMCDLSGVTLTEGMVKHLPYMRFHKCDVTGMDFTKIAHSSYVRYDYNKKADNCITDSVSEGSSGNGSGLVTGENQSRCFEFVECKGVETMKLPVKSLMGSCDSEHSVSYPILVI